MGRAREREWKEEEKNGLRCGRDGGRRRPATYPSHGRVDQVCEIRLVADVGKTGLEVGSGVQKYSMKWE